MIVKKKNNPFLTYYINQTPIDDSLLINTSPILIGSDNAPVCITLITDPLCESLQVNHVIITELCKEFQENLSIRLVFNVPYHNLNDPKTMLAAWLVETYLNDKAEGIAAIRYWYSTPDIKLVQSLTLISGVIKEKQSYLKSHTDWCLKKGLTSTPLILINNKPFPIVYRTKDLKRHIASIIKFEKNRDINSYKLLRPANTVLRA